MDKHSSLLDPSLSYEENKAFLNTAPGIVFTNFFLCNLQMGNAGVWHYIRLERLARNKLSCSLEPFLSYEENKGFGIRPLESYSQAFFFVTYKWVKYAGVLNHGTLKKLTMDKHSSLLDPSLSYEENRGFLNTAPGTTLTKHYFLHSWWVDPISLNAGKAYQGQTL